MTLELTRKRIILLSIAFSLLNIFITFYDAEGFFRYFLKSLSITLSLLSLYLIWISLNIAYFHVSPRFIKLKDIVQRKYAGTLSLAPSYIVDVETRPLYKTPKLDKVVIIASYHFKIIDITYRGRSIFKKCTEGIVCLIREEKGEQDVIPTIRPDSEIRIEFVIDKEKLEKSEAKLYLDIQIHEIIWPRIRFKLQYHISTSL